MEGPGDLACIFMGKLVLFNPVGRVVKTIALGECKREKCTRQSQG